MEQIKKAFQNTKVNSSVNELLETGKASFDLVDLTGALYIQLVNSLCELGYSLQERRLYTYTSTFTLRKL